MLRAAVTSGCAVLVICWTAAQTVHADTLNGALTSAYQTNPQLNSQRAVVRATDESVPQALSGYKPTVSATLQTAQQYNSTVAKVPPTPDHPGANYPRLGVESSPSSITATVTQNVFNGFQTANRVRAAETNTSAARESLRVAEQTILLNAATAYMDLLRDSALLELQRRNVEVLQEQLRQTRDRFNVGEVTRTDVAQAESRLAQGRAQVLSAEASYARSRANYRQFVGVEAGALQPGAPVDRLTPRRLVEAIEIARTRHPSVGVAMFGIDAAVLQVKINEGSLYPQVRLIGQVSQNWEANLSTQLQQFNAFVQGQVSIPIFNAGPAGASDTFSSIRAAKETVGQKRMDLDTARDQVQANVVTAWGQLDAARAQILATQAQVASAEIALNGVREEARVGQRTTLDVLNSQQELVNARTALVTAQHDRVVASYSLLSAVGELNLPKLGITIPLYDPMVHYQQVRDAWIGVRIPDGR
ncbi:MAG TPA: TolC family outer membrane protein [Xanthobacteraceae bacterium]|nr:TolC family outer membrane protein [Xanthobacteraceae bacterium]